MPSRFKLVFAVLSLAISIALNELIINAKLIKPVFARRLQFTAFRADVYKSSDIVIIRESGLDLNSKWIGEMSVGLRRYSIGGPLSLACAYQIIITFDSDISTNTIVDYSQKKQTDLLGARFFDENFIRNQIKITPSGPVDCTIIMRSWPEYVLQLLCTWSVAMLLIRLFYVFICKYKWRFR